MALEVGELYAKLTLNDAEFKRKLDAVERDMSRAAKASTAAFAAIAGSIAAATTAAVNYANEAQALAGQTGLAAESVQALGFAARRSDTDLDTLGRGMRSLIRRAADAVQGNEALRADFEAIGISADELARLLHDPEELLLRVADGLAALPTTAQAAAAAMNTMGDSGRRLVPFLRQGSDVVQSLSEQSRDLGLVLGRETVRELTA